MKEADFIQKILEENLRYLGQLIIDKPTGLDFEDIVYMVNRSALMCEDLIPVLSKRFTPYSKENGLLLLLKELVPLTLLMCNRTGELSSDDRGEIYKTYKEIKDIVIKVCETSTLEDDCGYLVINKVKK